MDVSARQQWLRATMLVGIVYVVVGITFAALANSSASHQMRVTWRLAAWLASAAAFAFHVGYEHFRLRNSPATAALHVSLAVALGAFALAAAANIHAQWAGSNHRRALAVALVVWPAMTGVPAFVVSLAAGVLLARRRRGALAE